MYIPSQIDIESLIDAAKKAHEEGLAEYISYRLLREAQQRLLIFGDDENAARLHHRISQGFVLLEVDQECPKKYEKMSLIEILVDIYGEYDAKNENDGVEGSSETREKFLTTSKLLRTALKMLIRVERGDTSEEDFIRVKGIREEFVQDTKYDEVFIESSSTAAATDLQASCVNAIEYLIDAAETIFIDDDIPEYVSYRLSRNAQQRLKGYGIDENATRLRHRILQIFVRLKEDQECPEKYKEMSLIEILVDIYLEYDYKNKIDRVEGSSEKSERFLTPSKVLTALEMLIRVERGDTSEKDFIRENVISEEDTESDEGSYTSIESSSTASTTDLQASRLNANMDVPSKRDIEYLIDAAEKTSFDDDIPKYISYILFYEAHKTLEKLKNDQIGPAENTEDLESRISKNLWRITYEGKKIPKFPERYRECESVIQVLVVFYRRYNKKKKIDKLHNQDENHKKWGFLSPNFRVLEDRSAMREKILTISKALRTALKMLCQVERGDTSEEVFIQENEIPNEFLQDTEYDEDVTYNIIPFDDLPDLLPEVNRAIASLKWGIEATPSPTRGCDVLDCLQKLFGFQESSVSNQRENIVILLSNEQMRLGKHETAFDKALQSVFDKSLGNYIEWCRYLSIDPIWENMDDENRKKKRILYISLYYLIWGEAANVRFLPECLCYIFHRMREHLDKYLRLNRGSIIEQVPEPLYRGSFIDQVIQPLYKVIAAEAKIKKEKNVSHSKWRNYDDLNEYFWSKDCLELSWPLNGSDSPFFSPPEGSTTVFGKTSFVEHRTFLHLYHSFHRMWIFHVMMFEALVIFAFNDGELNFKMLTETLPVTYFLMMLIQSMFDIWLKYGGAYSKTSRVDVMQIVIRFIGFMSATLNICFSHMKCLQEMTSSILGIYAVFKILFSILSHFLPKKYENSSVARLIKWINQEEYVGRGMNNDLTDIFWYMIFWIVTLGINVALTYYGLIRPLVRATRDITDVSKNIHNMLTIGSLWAGVICAYIVGSHVVYNAASAVVGTFVGDHDGLGKIKSLGDVHKCFDGVPTAFMDHLHTPLKNSESRLENNQQKVKKKGKLDAEGFSPFWNQIVMHLREEDYISDSEQNALNMPEKSGCIDVVQWPLFLLVGKVFHASRLLQTAQQHTQSRRRRVWERLLQRVQQLTQSRLGGVWERLLQRLQQQRTHKDMWNKISRYDVYIKYAVEECFHSVKFILCSVLDNEGKEWVEEICNDIESSIARDGNLCSEFQLKELDSFVEAIIELIMKGLPHDNKKYVNKYLKKVIKHDFLGEKKFAGEQILISDSDWGTNLELWIQIKRLYSLLTMRSANHVPRNREARRRLEFFTNSLFMSMPTAKPVREMLSFSVLTPYYEETVLYSLDELESSNDDGVTLIDYLKNLYPDEWTNYCERIDSRYTDDEKESYEYRLWASYRGQTLARTVRGTMYYQKALLLQAYREMLIAAGLGVDGLPSTSPVPNVSMDKGSQCLDNAKAHVDLKFTYVVSCQIYGKQKIEEQKFRHSNEKRKDKKLVAADIAFLLKKNEGLRVAFVDQVNDEFYSKLVKADKNGKDKEVYSIKLPGNPILGEGKPENQNHAIVFTRGNAIQTIDMNQDNYFEETLKMRNLLEEFHRKHVIRPPTILGIREHIFTGSASSLASFMSNQETGFVTLGQRVIANPLKVRMHYGHPDVFDRVFHITRGGISKASRGINISEDIYAGFNSTLRQGSVTHHEYIQVGKGRDVGFNQIATFEGKVAGGNGEQVLSRDIYRLGQRFDFFRMLSLYYTTVGYYFSSLLMVITLYILLYGNLIMALSGTRVPHLLNDIDMAPEWFLMIVLLPAIYMLLVPYLEQGLEKAVESFLAMFFSLGPIFFAFSLGTRIHWFGRTIIHGGASYQATGRGFVLHHIKFSENYRRYSRSHFVKGMEVLFLLVVYCIYGFHSVRAIYNNLLLLGGLILSISWIVAPFLFDSSPFDLYINSEDRKDWKNWRNSISDKVEESWEAWWNKELDHIRTPAGRVIETILSLRFFIFPLVVGYKLDVQGLGKSFSNCVIPWICLVVILFFYEVFFKKKQVIHFFSYNRMATIGALAIAYYYSAFGDMLTFTIAIITTILGFILFFNGRVAIIGAPAIAYYYSFGCMPAFIMAIITTIWGFISFFNSRVATIGALAIVCYYSDFGSILAFIIAIITTLWGFISICVAWKPALQIFSLWIPVKYLAWICDTGMRVLSFNINARDDLSMLLLYLLIYVSDACEAWKPTLKRFSLWTPVPYLAWICDTGMGALMFKIANMFSQRSIKQYLVRNMFVHNVSELLHKSSAENASLYGRGF